MLELISELNVSASNATQVITGLTKSEVVIELTASHTFRNGDLIEPLFRSGNVFRVRWIQESFKGNLVSLPYGVSEIAFDVPNPLSEYGVEVIPSRLQFDYSIKVWERVLNPRFDGLVQALGIPDQLLALIPSSSLELVLPLLISLRESFPDSMSSQLVNILREIQMSLVNPISINIPAEMDNSTKFTRSIAVNLVAGVSSVLAPVNDNRTGAVLRNPGAFDVYLCLADVATAASAIAVLEPNGFYELAPADYNGAISVICPAGGGSIAGSEMASTAFAAIGAGLAGEAVPGSVYMARYNPLVNDGSVESSLDAGVTWTNINSSNGIESAKLDINGVLHYKTKSGLYFYGAVPNTEWLGSNSGNYEGLDSNPATIVL